MGRSGDLKPEDRFTVSCNKDLDCFTDCCRDRIITLSPYEVLRLKNYLDIPSNEFMDKYTGSYFPEVGLPIIFLRMGEDEKKTCPFVGDDGCKVYKERPMTCRSFPLAPEKAVSDAGPPKLVYSVDPLCRGVTHGDTTVRLWRINQGLDTYNELEEMFNSITLNNTVAAQRVPDEKVHHLFFLGAYNLDMFRDFVFNSGFLDVFDIDEETLKSVEEDDEALLKLGLTWLKYGLIDNEALKVKQKVE